MWLGQSAPHQGPAHACSTPGPGSRLLRTTARLTPALPRAQLTPAPHQGPAQACSAQALGEDRKPWWQVVSPVPGTLGLLQATLARATVSHSRRRPQAASRATACSAHSTSSCVSGVLCGWSTEGTLLCEASSNSEELDLQEQVVKGEINRQNPKPFLSLKWLFQEVYVDKKVSRPFLKSKCLEKSPTKSVLPFLPQAVPKPSSAPKRVSESNKTSKQKSYTCRGKSCGHCRTNAECVSLTRIHD